MSDEQNNNPLLGRATALERFEVERAALDRELLNLMAKRRDTFSREAAARIQAGIPIDSSLHVHKLTLEKIVGQASRMGLDASIAEKVFTALTTEGLNCFGNHTTTMLARPENARVVMKTARQRGVPPDISTALFTTLHNDDAVIADEREAHDLAAVVELLTSGAISNGFVTCSLDHFEDLARLVEILTVAEVKIVGRATMDRSEDEESASPQTILALAREIPKQPGVTTWWTWIFLRVPEGRSIRSTDLLIKALLTARHHRIDTSHIHSLPGLSYEGFSYSQDEPSVEHPSRYRLSGSRSFLIDSRRSPSPQELERLISALVGLGCFAQLLCCVPLRGHHSPDAFRENPIQRMVTTLKAS